jgi:hypothetical protein
LVRRMMAKRACKPSLAGRDPAANFDPLQMIAPASNRVRSC